MDDFEAMNPEEWSRLPISHIAGHVLEFSKNQTGSRFIQEKFESITA